MALRSSFRVFRHSIASYLASVDVPLFVAVTLVMGISILNLYGIGGVDHTLFRKQIFITILGLGLMVFFSWISYRFLKNYRGPVLIVYVVSLILVAMPLFFSTIRNIRAWIVIGGYTFEPSELAKLAFVILMAKYFSQRHVHISQFRHILVSGIYCAIPTLIILAQPDLGSAAIILVVWVTMLISVGVNKRHLFLLAAAAVVGAYLAWMFAFLTRQVGHWLGWH